jgi:hypothetical protein
MHQIHMIPCTFPDPDKEGHVKNGFFHTWGDRSEYVGKYETVVTNTVAIVEDEEGEMYIVEPTDLKMNRKKE